MTGNVEGRLTPPLPVEDLDHILDRTRGLWEELRGHRIFITGGTGFFGIWLLKSFTTANHQLSLGARAVVLTRDPDVFARKAPDVVQCADLDLVGGDVRDFKFPEGSFSVVLHAASPTNRSSDPKEILDTIIDGTRRVLEFAATCGARKFLLTSSGAVYGCQPSNLTHIPEDYRGAPDPLDPSSAYGVGKRVAETLCCVAAQKCGFEAKIARCFAFLGPHLPLNSYFAIGNFIRDALSGGPICINGDGTVYRSYLYAADLAVWLWTILFRGKSGRAYNVGSARDLTILEIARAVNEALGKHCEIQVPKSRISNQTLSRYVPDVRRAEGELGLRDSYGLDMAIRKTAAWHQSHNQCAPNYAG